MTDHQTEKMAQDEELLVAYCDGEMEADERRKFELRLAAEPDLKARHETYCRAMSLLKVMGPAEAPPSMLPALEKRLGVRRDPRTLLLRFPMEVLVTLAVLMATVLLYFQTTFNDEQAARPVRTLPQPVEVTVSDTPAQDVLEEFQLKVVAQSDTRLLAYGPVPNPQVARLLDRLGTLVVEVTGYPGQGCEPCEVIILKNQLNK